MAKIVSKLDLNKTPQIIDNNSLIFAKNTRILKDGTIGPDFPIDSELSVPGIILGYIIGLNSNVYLFVGETPTTAPSLNLDQFYEGIVPNEATLKSYTLDISNEHISYTYTWEEGQDLASYVSHIIIAVFGGKIVRQFQSTNLSSNYPFTTRLDITCSYILNDEEIFYDSTIIYNRDEENINYNIYSYNENNKSLYKINSAWTYSGGKIHGICTTNNTGDIILTVCEYFDDNSKLVPIKHINLTHCSKDDDESIYTQTPNIPYTNFKFVDYYINTIPNGVYQFFIRYKIYKDFYTDWFPCSGECFTGDVNVTNTIQGSIQYVDTTLNSNKSFVFEVEHLLNGENQDEPDYTKNFKEFQIGFIVAHDDSINARAWKHFPMSTNRIYFDYDKDFITEINIDDLLRSVYEISNVKNITYFRNRLYIANYIESNINEDLYNHAFNIDCNIVQKELSLDNSDVSQTIVIEEKTFPAIAGTSDPILYNISIYDDLIISKNITDTVITPSDYSEGLIYKVYYKAYPGLDPDQFFIKAGYDCSINNGSSVNPLYSIPNVLKTFCLKNANDASDFEDIYFYNNQTTTADNAGQLVYDDPFDLSNWVYSRVLGTPDTKQTITMGDDETRGVYIHPLNDCIDWFCAVCKSKDLTNKEVAFSVNSINSDFIIFSLALPIDGYNKKYCIETYGKSVDWDDENECKNWDNAERKISEEILKYIKNVYPKYVLKSVTLYSNNDPIPIIQDFTDTSRMIYYIEDESSIEIKSRAYNDFRGISDKALIRNVSCDIDFVTWCNNYISPNVIDANGNAYYKYNNVYKKIDRVEIEYAEFNYDYGEVNSAFSEDGGLDDGEMYTITSEFKASVKKHFTTIYYSAKKPETINNAESIKVSAKSLVPFTDYKFYIHYIKSNGVVTNGYQIGNTTYRLRTFDESLEHSVIYPTFDNITLPEGYNGYFISIEKVGDDIASCFNIRSTETEVIVDCLEIDSMLYPLNDNITILDSNGNIVTEKAKYYPSSTTDPAMLLGNAGCIRWNIADEYNYDSSSSESSDEPVSHLRYWVCIKNNSENSSTNRLIKLTPYLNSGSFCVGDQAYAHNDYTKLNIPGYYCSVCKPIDITLNATSDLPAGELYVNGSDLYRKYNPANSDAIQIVEHDSLMTHIDTYNTTPYYVYSNFNLTYLTLFDMAYKQVKYKRYLKVDEDTGQTVENYKQMLFMLDSSTLSYIYTLPSMYKDYTRKLYSSIQTDKLYIFDNVIRVSDVNTDEIYKYIYKFDALDYYNVPANKGKIVNLFNITQNIFIHCEHSLFKFSGDNTLTAKDTEVQLTENDIFDTGIIELFDSEHGFAGLQIKHQSLVTYNAYVFYDGIANTIYAYFGENNLVKLSDEIHKILNSKDFTDVLFNADTEDDRFFINFIYPDYTNLCLSYNFNTKSFVSIHDFTFNYGFFTRNRCYFLNSGKVDLYSINKSILYSSITNNFATTYSTLYKTSKLFIKDMVIPEMVNDTVENCLDVVCNVEYETIKVLNYINWICNQINKYADDIDGVNLFVAEENISKYAGSKLRIYTDQCSTDLINLENSNGEIYEQNTQSISNPNSYMYPRYNCGVWSLNYFRDVRNIEDIFNYKNAIPPTQQEEAYNRGLVNSDRSLIYGKYFVLRLIFRNKNFKLENINFNIQDYEKV